MADGSSQWITSDEARRDAEGQAVELAHARAEALVARLVYLTVDVAPALTGGVLPGVGCAGPVPVPAGALTVMTAVD